MIPAPQALLKADRPKRLPPVSGLIIVGAFSGTKVEELNFAANLVHEVGDLKRFAFQEYTITYKYDDRGRTQTDIDLSSDPEQGKGSRHGRRERDVRLQAKYHSPLNILTVLSCAATAGLFIWSIFLQDGVAALSITCMSFASTFTGLALWWTPKLATRPSSVVVPKGDLVLRTRNGAFIVIHCTEEIARELYTGSDEVKYHFGSKVSRLFVGLGTLFLMVAVVLLGNCNWTMQAAIGVAYLLLNGVYWLVSLLPQSWAWHTAAYKIETEHNLPDHVRFAHEAFDIGGTWEPASYTRTLWYAIHRSRSSRWLSPMGAAPQTDAWREWIDEAMQNLNNPDWPAVPRKDYYMKKHTIDRDVDRNIKTLDKDELGKEGVSTRADSRSDVKPEPKERF